MPYELEADGFSLRAGFVRETDIRQLEALLSHSAGQAGLRIFANPLIVEWLASSGVTSAVRSILGHRSRPVRAILFDKASDANWSLDWHQDRTIAVRERHDLPGFGNWTQKSGHLHAEPPFSIIDDMMTARIHIDPVDNDNAPLFVARGSHRHGRIAESEIAQVAEQCERVLCHAKRGDVWLYRTSVLHGSEASRTKPRRRVLQVDFSATDLPPPLEWTGVA